MATKGLILCVCQGTCPSFDKMNLFEILNRARREKLVDWVALHPQLCADDGDVYLATFLKGTDVEKLYVAGCDSTMQRKMFRDAFGRVGFDAEKHVGIEIRNMDTDEAYEAIKSAAGDDGRSAAS